MLAIIETGGKQHKVAVGQKIKVEKLASKSEVWTDLKAGDPVTFDKVLLYSAGADKANEAQVGKPFLSNVSVTGKVVEQGKSQKIIVFKQKQRKGYRRKRGHRQTWTLVEITDIKVA
jgi:large subunit ribosomal protein L21